MRFDVSRGAGRDREPRIGQRRGPDLMRGRLLREDQTHLEAFLLGLAARGVMDLEAHLGPRGDLAGEALGVDAGAVARHIDRPVALPAFVRLAHFGTFLMDTDDHVMDDVPFARQDLVGRDPAVFLEFGLHDVVSVRHEACGLDVVGFAELHDQVGLADAPLSRVKALGRSLGCVAEGAIL